MKIDRAAMLRAVPRYERDRQEQRMERAERMRRLSAQEPRFAEIDRELRMTGAAAVRAARDALLAASDQRMTLDRGLNLKLPDTVTAATLLTAFKDIITGLKDALSGDWAKYRQALRDLTTQEGFPFNVIWPSAPTSNE